MIIASSAKKDMSIQLQVLQPSSSAPVSSPTTNAGCLAPSSTSDVEQLYIRPEYSSDENNNAVCGVVQLHSRQADASHDFVSTVFGHIQSQVSERMTISTIVPGSTSKRNVHCHAFIYKDTVFLSSPVVGNDAGLLNWSDGEFQSCVTHLIELAEDKTGCSYLVIVIDRRNMESVLRAFMYLGFQLVDPSVYGQDPGFILVGYEL